MPRPRPRDINYFILSRTFFVGSSQMGITFSFFISQTFLVHLYSLDFKKWKINNMG
jgi:hypothetical protein